jgi:putative transposase
MGIFTIPRIGFSTVRFSVSRLDWRNGSANPFWTDLTKCPETGNAGREGTKHVLGLRQGSTETKVLCGELLQDLVGRGLRNGAELRFVVDGGKALRAAISAVFGDQAVVQRCQQHKRRNVLEHLPVARQKTVDRMLVDAYKSESLKTARKRLAQIVSWLDRNGEEDAAASLREGLEESLTVWKLDLPEALRRFFATTNAIENVMGTIRRVSRNVKRWRHGAMAKRWAALGLGAAQARFKRIKGHRQLPVLFEALKRRAAATVGQDEALRSHEPVAAASRRA